MHSISRTPSIYQIRHIETNKVYVGSTFNPQKRCKEHRNDLRAGRHRSRYLQRAWDKYGESAFVFEIIEPVLFIEDLVPREQYWINRLQSADLHYGYNLSPTAGSSIGVKHTQETIQKQRNRRPTPETRAKLSEAQRNRSPFDASTRQKMSLARRGEKSPTSKLTEKEVRDIRAYSNEGYTQAALADMFHVDRSLIGYIVRNVIWKDPNYVQERGGPRRKLTRDQAKTVCELYATGQYTQQVLAEQFGVSRTIIWKAIYLKLF